VLSPLDVLLLVSRTLERLGTDYVVVGSFASSARGRARATADVDLIADVRDDRVPLLAAELTDAFYLDEHAIRRAVAGHRSFNLIHLDTMFKVDVFIPPRRRSSDSAGCSISRSNSQSLRVPARSDLVRGSFVWDAEEGLTRRRGDAETQSCPSAPLRLRASA
jgi:hypothetical protein